MRLFVRVWPAILATVAGGILVPRPSLADLADAPNDFGIVLADPRVDPPPVLARNPVEANATFDRRATRLLKYAGCRPELANPVGSDFLGVFNSAFSTNLETWGFDALAKLAYTGTCGPEAFPGTQAAADRYRAVDEALSQLTIPPGLVEGSSVSLSASGVAFDRNGDLDTGLKELIPILYLFADRIPQSFTHVLDLLQSNAGGPAPLNGAPPYFSFAVDLATGTAVPNGLPPPALGEGGGISLFVPETENHSLLELSNQYLTNQLVNRVAQATQVDNSVVHQAIMGQLTGILETDFFEYNAKPYQHYALYAIENLAQFADDSDVQAMAHTILDYSAAKFAVSSSLLRRAAPYRRLGSHDGNFLTGTQADEQACRFFLYSGELEALATTQNGHRVYAAQSFCDSAVRQVIDTYRVPDVILDLAFTPDLPYIQRFSGGANYYANLYAGVPGGTPVRGTTEIYDNELTFFIAGGGLPEPNGLPILVTGIDVDLGPGFVSSFDPSVPATIGYPVSDEDVGISLPILLMPDDRRDPSQPDDAPIVDRRDFVRIEGTGHQGANLCVAPGFACGKNPTMPAAVTTSNCTPEQPWQFADLPSAPVHTYVAMLCEPAYLVPLNAPQVAPGEQPLLAPYTLGLFEAEPANRFDGFDDFQRQVRANNPKGAALIEEHDGFPTAAQMGEFSYPQPPCAAGANTAQPCYVVTGWSGRYTKTDGTRLDFIIPIEETPNTFANPSPFGSYPVTSPDIALPPTDPTSWDLAEGPVRANHEGVVTVVDPRDGRACVMSMTDPTNPERSGCEATCTPRCSNGFPCVSDDQCSSRACAHGSCVPSRCAPDCRPGAECGSNLDCASEVCVDGRCRTGAP